MTTPPPPPPPPPFADRGHRVQAIRHALNMSGNALAAFLSTKTNRPLDKTTISRIEAGERDLSLDEAAALAKADPNRPVRDSLYWIATGK